MGGERRMEDPEDEGTGVLGTGVACRWMLDL